MNFLLARVTKLDAHARFLKSTILIKIGDARFLKSTILIKIGDMFVKLILMGRKCDKISK